MHAAAAERVLTVLSGHWGTRAACMVSLKILQLRCR